MGLKKNLMIFVLLVLPTVVVHAQTVEQRAHGRGIELFPYPFARTFYIQPRFDRQDYDDGTYFNAYVIRTFSTYWNRMHFRVELPFANTNISGTNIFGLSDISVRAVRAQEVYENLFFGYGLQLVMNTATHESLGAGKWDVRPGIGLIYFMGTPQNVSGTILFSAEYRTTLAKESGRTSTNVLAISPNIDFWFKKWYIGYYATWTYDFSSDLFDLPLDIELGYSITPSLTLAAEFIQPLIWPRSYKNEFAVKLRYSFEPKRK